MTDPVLFDTADGVAVITINRPERANAIDPAAADAIAEAIHAVETDDGIGAAIVTGAGPRHFCAGSDLKAKAAGTPPARNSWGFGGFVRAPRAKPYIAAVNGIAVGGGFELALACDLVVAAEHAAFGLPEVTHGVVAGGGGLIRLGRRLPPALATEIAIAGRTLSAHEAQSLGLVNSVVPQDALAEAATALARTCLAGAPLAVRESLAVLRLADGSGEDSLWRRSAQASATVLASEDGQEGPRAFAERRTPTWRNTWSDAAPPARAAAT
ncbi:enoyl-CoA hydratase-related protein [Georgenia sp. AZ-5]|uniref:enoyl-CoA hydratase-related protein n=1 Tax=Georgenia sp. AZ-5 TaxID=3367526 RepID=UPI0037543189